ncbi:MAG: GAF domain-containing protein, partial [Myxococcales bacterium]|nr:GAF domain-containing protein [Myxococcales bacterium]
MGSRVDTPFPNSAARERLARTHAALERHREYLSLLQAIAAAANEAERLEPALDEALAMICQSIDWPVGHAFIVEPVKLGRVARPADAWSISDDIGVDAFRRRSDKITFSAGEGVIGEVIVTKEPLWLDCDRWQERLLRAEQAAEAGFESMIAVPVLARDQVVAVMEFFTRLKLDPQAPLLELLADLGAILGRVAEREAAELARRRLIEARVAELHASREAREYARLAEQLRRKNKELDQFAYVASHDLKAPLRGIANLTDWLVEELEPHLTETSREHISLLRGRVQRMEALIDALLAYSRARPDERAPERVDCEALARDVVDLLGAPASVTTTIHPMPQLFTEALALRQVLHNLVANAIKHCEREGCHVEIGATPRDGVYEFWVRDDGPGIEEIYHERIWRIFQTLRPRDEVEG